MTRIREEEEASGDSEEISHRQSKFIGQTNSVLCDLGMLAQM